MPLSVAGGDDAGHRGPVTVRVDVEAEPTSDVPATSLPARSGCEASTPVSSTATTAEPVGVTSRRPGPSRSSAGTTGRRRRCRRAVGLGGAAAVELDARRRASRRAARRRRCRPALTACMRRTAIESVEVAPAAAIAASWLAADMPVANVTMKGARRLGRRGGGGLRGGLGRGFGRSAPESAPPGARLEARPSVPRTAQWSATGRAAAERSAPRRAPARPVDPRGRRPSFRPAPPGRRQGG